MKKTILIMTMLALIVLAGCTQTQRNEEELLIIASTFPMYEFARAVAPQENVEMLVPPGVDVHHHDLRPSDLIKLDSADLIIFTGEEMEPWLERVLDIEGKHKGRTLKATEKTQLIKAENGHSHDHDEHGHDHDDELKHLIEKIDHVVHEWEDGDILADDAMDAIEELLHEYLEHGHDHEHDEKDEHGHDHDDELEHLIEKIDYLVHEWEDGDILADDAMDEIEELLHEYLEHEHDDDGHDHSHDSEYDPHVWLDFENSIEIVNAIASKLSNIKPEREQEYRQNADNYIRELRELDQNYGQGLQNCETRAFITNHDSFRYLAQKYDLEQIPIRGLSAEQEPSPRTIANIIQEAREHDIRHVFFEELASPRVSEAIAREIGAETLMLTPAENVPARDFGQRTFIDIMTQNLENLKVGLRCN